MHIQIKSTIVAGWQNERYQAYSSIDKSFKNIKKLKLFI